MRHRHAVDKLWRVEEDGGGGAHVWRKAERLEV